MYTAKVSCSVYTQLGALTPVQVNVTIVIKLMVALGCSVSHCAPVYILQVRSTPVSSDFCACIGRPASMHHESDDAHTFADLWNVDYVKEDSCSGCGHVNATEQYANMSAALNATGKRILFGICWGCTTEIELRPAIGNSWRIGPDDGNWNNVLININIDSQLALYAGPGHWNNPCLLISVSDDGSNTCTAPQSRTQFSAYAILAAPLMISGTILHMSECTLETYLNKEVLCRVTRSTRKTGWFTCACRT